jgi:dihydroflavonol-4-reductase
MKTLYLVTGASGHLGSTICRQLLAQKQAVCGFDRPGTAMLGGVEPYFGDVTDPESLRDFLKRPAKTKLILIHCAGIVSISSHYDPRVYEVNVLGTKTVLHAVIDAKVDKFVHISSVHAIPEPQGGGVITEVDHFDPDQVVGLYAKTKAEGAQYVLEVAGRAGLDFNIIHPSGLTGPYDNGHGHVSALVIDYYNGRLTSGVRGGYDFVDVRDVSAGIISACRVDKPGKCYILSNKYYSARTLLEILAKMARRKPIRSYLPLWFARLTAPFSEIYYRLLKTPPLYTSYSLYTLRSNSNFSHELASKELGYTTRDMHQTLRDTVNWFKKIGLIKEEK